MLSFLCKCVKALGVAVVAVIGLAVYFTGLPFLGTVIIIVCLFWWAIIFDFD